MKKLIETLTENENLALMSFKKLQEKFGNVEVILFGSKSRGDYSNCSDIHILVILDQPLSNFIEEIVFDIGFAIEIAI